MVEISSNDNLKYFYRYVSNLYANSDYPSFMFFEDELAENGDNILNLFAENFGSVYSNQDLSPTAISCQCYDSLSSLTFSQNDVGDLSNDLKRKFSPGPDFFAH